MSRIAYTVRYAIAMMVLALAIVFDWLSGRMHALYDRLEPMSDPSRSVNADQ